MGLFDEALNAVKGQIAGGVGGQSGLMGVIMGLVNNPKTGGLAGLVTQLTQGGLGSAVSSWVSTGENQAVSSDAIHNALGSGKIRELAAQAGITPEMLSAGLAKFLPGVVDKLTPNGEVPR